MIFGKVAYLGSFNLNNNKIGVKQISSVEILVLRKRAIVIIYNWREFFCLRCKGLKFVGGGLCVCVEGGGGGEGVLLGGGGFFWGFLVVYE